MSFFVLNLLIVPWSKFVLIYFRTWLERFNLIGCFYNDRFDDDRRCCSARQLNPAFNVNKRNLMKVLQSHLKDRIRVEI